MANTTTHTVYGKPVKWSTEEIEGFLLDSAEATDAKDVKEYRNMAGQVVSIVEYNPRASGSFSGTMLANSDVEAVKAAISVWLTTQATTVFSLPTGGTSRIYDVKIAVASEDAWKLSGSFDYFPSVINS